MKIISVKDKDYKIIPRTRKVVEITEKIKGKNLNEVIFGGLKDNDLKTLAELLKAFTELDNDKVAFNSINAAYDFIDDYMIEKECTISELYKEVIEVVNEMGFFKKKMTAEEIAKEIENPISDINLDQIIQQTAEKAIAEIAQEEFKGYQG